MNGGNSAWFVGNPAIVFDDMPMHLLGDQLAKMIIVDGIRRMLEIVVEQAQYSLVNFPVLQQVRVADPDHERVLEGEMRNELLMQLLQRLMNQMTPILARNGVLQRTDQPGNIFMLGIYFRNTRNVFRVHSVLLS